MKQIIEYHLVAKDIIFDFNTLVNEYIKDGWEPYESPFISGNLKCQAMVKYKIFHDILDPKYKNSNSCL
jgi:hypothetical protein